VFESQALQELFNTALVAPPPLLVNVTDPVPAVIWSIVNAPSVEDATVNPLV
jgi:hypothetical protein